MDTPPGLKYRSFSFAAGEDYSFDISIEPAGPVIDWTVQFAAFGTHITFTFPPLTIVPVDTLFYPAVPLAIQHAGTFGVMPGVLPLIPTAGSSTNINLDNATRGGVVVADVDTGLFTVSLPAELTVTVIPQPFLWFLRRIDSGHNTLLKYGGFDVTPSPSGYF